MPIELAERMHSIQPSVTLALDKRANTLKQQGEPVINLTVGQPDFDTPEHIRQAAIQALNEGYTRYTAVDGIMSLKQAIAAKFQRDNQLEYEVDEILVSSGAKQSIFNLLMVLLNPGDEVVIPAPYWVSYPEAVKLTGARPVVVKTDLDQGYKLTADQLAAAITSNTKLFILNSPGNPTGAIYTADELRNLAQVLKNHPEVVILSDDIYEYLSWGEPFSNILNIAPELRDQVIIINGVSKAYAMTGWRIGYAAGPKSIIQAMKTLQSQSTSCANAMAQKAAEAAIVGDQSCVQTMVRQFKARHDLVCRRLDRLKYVRYAPSAGAFYNFINVEAVIEQKGLADDLALAEAVLQQSQVTLVPGSAFGSPGHLRLSFAMDEATLNEAFDRLEAYGM